MDTEILLAGAVYFVFVFFRAFQQRNVAFLHYKWVLPTSYGMSFSEVFIISLVALSVIDKGGLSWDLAWYGLSIGTGAGLGAICAMKLHERTLGSGFKKVPRTWGGKMDKIGGLGDDDPKGV